MTRSEVHELLAQAMGDDTNRGNGGWSDTNDKDIYRSNPREILARLKSSGLAIVPIEPSEAMMDAGSESHTEMPDDCAVIYRAMIAAAIKEQEGRD